MGFWADATPPQRNAFVAAWLGWILDAFDFTIFFLAMPEIGREFHLGTGETGWAITVTLIGRVVGGPLGGWLCDRFGRRRPMILSLVLYAVFDFLIAFAGSYRQILVLRFLFGVGMGAEYSAGTALAMEHWPVKSRGVASGLLQGSWAIGYFLAAAAYWALGPVGGWRALFWLAIGPAVLAIFVRSRVAESPAWLGAAGARVSVLELFSRHLRATVVGSLVLAGGFFSYYSLATFYPTLMQARGFGIGQVAELVIIFNAGMLGGAALCGILSERRGRRFAIALFAVATIPCTLPYLLPHGFGAVAAGALLGGFVGVGWAGSAPSYLSEQFPVRQRGVGVGTAYHIGALGGASAPLAVPALQRTGLSLEMAMAACAALGSLVMATAIWFRPERRGVALD